MPGTNLVYVAMVRAWRAVSSPCVWYAIRGNVTSCGNTQAALAAKEKECTQQLTDTVKEREVTSCVSRFAFAM
eukprot:903556-Rhodomonas_salina.3